MPTSRRTEIIKDTLRGLGQRRRWLPIVCLCLPVCGFELWVSPQPRSVLIPLLMSIALPLIAPTTWRLLFSQRQQGFELRLLAYFGSGIAWVALLGALLPWLMGVSWTFSTDPATLLLAALIFWVGGWTLGRDIDLEHHLARAIAYGESKALQAEHAQMLAIRRHLDPHFLYNTLNALAEWCQQAPAIAEEGILQLSQMLRVLLDGIERPTWPLSQELALVEALIDLYRLRDPGRLDGRITLEGHILYDTTSTGPEGIAVQNSLIPKEAAALQQASVPPMAVLSLVENAIKHGPWAGHKGTIELHITQADQQLQIDVANPGPLQATSAPSEGNEAATPQAQPDEASSGKGLRLLRRRLLLLYDERASCRLWEEEGRTIARLRLPMHREDSATEKTEIP